METYPSKISLGGNKIMDIDQLNDKRNNILGELKAYYYLQLGLEQISKYNRENHTNDKLKVYTTAYEPHLEEITELSVAEKIEKLTNNLLTLSEKINIIKMNSK